MNNSITSREFRDAVECQLSGLRPDPWLAQRIIASEEGEKPMKKRIPVALVLAIVCCLGIATLAIAEIVGVNIFDLFGKTDERYAQLAPYSVLDEISEVSVNSIELGSTKAGIQSAYYDGQTLIIGYSIQNAFRMEEFTPSEDLLAKMTRSEENIVWVAANEEEAELIAKLEQAKAAGVAMGLVSYSVYPSDHTVSDDGIDIGPPGEEILTGADGIEYIIREHETLLDDALQNREELTVRIRLYQGANYLYFDGENLYICHEVQELPPMKATIWNAHPELSP